METSSLPLLKHGSNAVPVKQNKNNGHSLVQALTSLMSRPIVVICVIGVLVVATSGVLFAIMMNFFFNPQPINPPLASGVTYLAMTCHSVNDILISDVSSLLAAPSSSGSLPSLSPFRLFWGGAARISQARGLSILPSLTPSALPLLALQALTQNPKVLLLPSLCSPSAPLQAPTVIATTTQALLSHPYSAALVSTANSSYLLITNQNSNAVSKVPIFNTPQYALNPSVPPTLFATGLPQPRAICLHPLSNTVLVAVRDLNAIVELDSSTGIATARSPIFSVPNPINVMCWSTFVLIGSGSANTVTILDIRTLTTISSFTSPLLVHPSGFALLPESPALPNNLTKLLVASQQTSTILSWNIANLQSPVFSGVVASQLPLLPESFVLFTCP